jgi:hypothetical protein
MGKLSSLSSRLKTSEMGISDNARSNNNKAFFHYNNVKPFNVKQKRGKIQISQGSRHATSTISAAAHETDGNLIAKVK